MVVEQEMEIPEMWATYMPMKALCFDVNSKYIGEKCIERFAETLNGIMSVGVAKGAS
jgi:hypothetical protein